MTDSRHSDYEIERNILARVNAQLVLKDLTTVEEVISQCSDADAILLDMAPMPKEVVDKLKKCKVISRYGVGYDNVDVDACTKKGIWVANVPDYCFHDVAEHAVALMFSALRQTALRDRLIRRGEWNIQSDAAFRLFGKTVGIMGGGRIATALIEKLSGFGLKNILVYDPYISADKLAEIGAVKSSMEELLFNSDIISLHMPVTNETRGIINCQTIKMMKNGVILINTARGALVDDNALLSALNDGTIAFAGLDTHNIEPLSKDSEFLKLDNVVLTDHCAYNTPEAVADLKSKTAQNVADVLAGGRPVYPVNRL